MLQSKKGNQKATKTVPGNPPLQMNVIGHQITLTQPPQIHKYQILATGDGTRDVKNCLAKRQWQECTSKCFLFFLFPFFALFL